MTDAVVPAKPGARLWQKGQSGNPAGRPKGSKNAITLVKAQIESELRGQMKEHMSRVVSEIIRQALPTERLDKDGQVMKDEQGRPVMLPGNQEMLKLLFNAWVSKTKSGDDEAPKEKIQIVIGKLDQVPPLSGKVYENGSAKE